MAKRLKPVWGVSAMLKSCSEPRTFSAARGYIRTRLLFLLACLALGASAAWAEDNLAARYAFDEGSGTTTADSSGNNNTGTLTGSPSWISGHLGSALHFSGSNCIVAPDSASLSVTGNITLAAWVRSADWHQWIPNIVAKDGNNSYRWRILGENYSEGLCQFETILNDGNGYASTWSGQFTAFSPNTWYHVAMTVDFSTHAVCFYKNGALVGSAGSTSKSSPGRI